MVSLVAEKTDGFSITGFGATKHHLNNIGLVLENIINKEEVQRYEDVCDSMISPQGWYVTEINVTSLI